MSEALFHFKAVTGGYGEAIVVRSIDGAVAGGEVLGITGRNGVGKTTLLNLLLGYLPLKSGSVTFQGRRLSGYRPDQVNQAGVSYCPQERIVFDDLSVWENLSLMHRGRKKEDLESYFQRFPRLSERLNQHAGTLSGGERKILSFVRAMAEDLPMAVMDEPTEGVQQENIDHMADLINASKAVGKAFIVVEQNLEFLYAISDRLVVMDQGASVLTGSVSELSKDQVIEHLQV